MECAAAPGPDLPASPAYHPPRPGSFAGLALQWGSHVLLSEGLVLLVSTRHNLWIRYRELLVTAGVLHQTWALLQLGEAWRGLSLRMGGGHPQGRCMRQCGRRNCCCTETPSLRVPR